jgi:pilus assembly protein Flp/PilA
MTVHTGPRAEDGASSVEYGLLISGVAALIVAIVILFGGAVNTVFRDSCGTINSHLTGSSCGP